MPLLDKITSPPDLKQLSIPDLAELAKAMRARIFDAVSRNGGHLASNLGVVELTIALHYVYDFGPFPTGPDRLLFFAGSGRGIFSVGPSRVLGDPMRVTRRSTTASTGLSARPIAIARRL